MTARSSTGNFSKFGTYFLYKLRSLRPLIILNGIFALLSYPFFGGILTAYSSNQADILAMRQNPDFYNLNINESLEYLALKDTESLLEVLLVMSGIIGFAMLVAMFIMSYIIISSSFRWLYKKNVVDMDYSLPVSDDTRFFGDLLASFAGSLVPHLIAIFTGSILWRIAFGSISGDEAEEFISKLLPDQVMYTGLFSCIMFMAFSLFVISLCGRGAEARIYPFVITAVVPVIHVICSAISLSGVYGLDYYVFDVTEMIKFSATSPLGMIFVTVYYFIAALDADQMMLPLFRLGTGLTAVIITIGLFVAAYFLIKKRRAERVGSPYVFKWVKPAIPAIVTFAVAAPFMLATFMILSEWSEENSYTPSVVGIVIAMFIVTFILYVIMELISGRGFKKFHMTLLKYVLTMAAGLLICVGLNASNGFGVGNYVPDPDGVAMVTFRIEDCHNSVMLNPSDVTDRETIAAITAIHRDVPKKDADNSYRFQFSVDYTMKDGSEVYRNYLITEEEFNDYIRRACTPEAFYASECRDRFGNGDLIQSITVQNNSLYPKEYHTQIPYDDFFDAYRSDCEGVTYEKAMCLGDDMYKVNLGISYRVNNESTAGYYTRWNEINVYSWMEDTRVLLEQHGIKAINEVDLILFDSAFLIEREESEGYISPADANIAFIMTGDDSVSQEILSYYGYGNEYIYSKDYNEKYGNEEMTETRPVATTTAYDTIYGSTSYVEHASQERATSVVDYKAVRIDMNDPQLKTILDCSTPDSLGRSKDGKVYSILLVSAENLSESLHEGYGSDERYISTSYYDIAAEMMAAYAN